MSRNDSLRTVSIKVTFKNGVFEPVEDVRALRAGQNFTVFTDEELVELRETLGWLMTADRSFEFWNNTAHGVYDTP